MLKDELKRMGILTRTARQRGKDDVTVFTAHVGDKSPADETISAFSRLGLEYEMCGTLMLLRATNHIASALNGLYMGHTSKENAFFRIYPHPAQLCHEHAALMHELRHLPCGALESDMPLLARGLRLIEGPCVISERTQFIRDVHNAAALGMRLKNPGDTVRACAYLIVSGGMKYET